jgi:rhamnogalacturonyl hydrolase YesR
MAGREPLDVARVLAARYPAQPIMSYIPALTWSSQLRLSAITGDPQWRDKALAGMRPFITDQTPAIAAPYRLTSLAGALAFHEAGSIASDRAATVQANKVAAFIMPDAPATHVRFATGWTDDMFMAGAVLARSIREPHAVLRKILKIYADKLQRPDGLFIHAADGPHAWGRGNGFALLGVTEALAHLPDTWPTMPEPWATRPQMLDVYRRHVAALAKHQSDDGSWRQVIDEPGSYRELTVTAMTVAALARGIGRGWIDRATYEPIMNRGWQAVTTRVNNDGTVKDVCSGTGAGPTKDYYLNRPVINGADDRGGAMALLAAIEMAELQRRSR